MLIICFSVLLSVNNLSAQSVWEEVIEQWVNNQESNSYQLENLIESLDELKENPLPINYALVNFTQIFQIKKWLTLNGWVIVGYLNK